MSCVWKPMKPPPVIPSFTNPETERVWQFLLAKHRRDSNLGPDPQNYYNEMYRKQFGVAPLNTQAQHQPSIRDEQVTPYTKSLEVSKNQGRDVDRVRHGSKQHVDNQSDRPRNYCFDEQKSQSQPKKYDTSLTRSRYSDRPFHINPQPDLVDRNSSTTVQIHGNLKDKSTTANDESCYELEFDFELPSQDSEPKSQNHHEGIAPQNHIQTPQNSLHYQKKGDNDHQSRGNRMWSVQGTSHTHKPASDPHLSSQDSLADVDLDILTSQPLFSQCTTQDPKHQSQESMEITREQVYCSPPLDLSPDMDTFAILSQMVRKSRSKGTDPGLKSKMPFGPCNALKEMELQEDMHPLLNKHTNPRKQNIESLSRSMSLYGTDRKEHDQGVAECEGLNTTSISRLSPIENLHNPEMRSDIEEISMDESYSTIAAQAQSRNADSSCSSSLSAFKNSLKNSADNSHQSKKRAQQFQAPKVKKDKTKDVQQKKRTKLDESTQSGEPSNPRYAGSIPVLSDVSSGQQYAIKQAILGAGELAITLAYKDGSCQLQQRAKKTAQKKQGVESEVYGVCMAYPGQNGGLHYLLIPFLDTTDHSYSFIRDLMDEVMTSCDLRKVCYDAQQVIYQLLSHFCYDHSLVCVQWGSRVEDLKIWGWLLQSDDPPQSFHHLLQQHCKDLLQQVERPDAEPRHWLNALGRACMALGRRLASVARQRELYEAVEQPLIPVLAIMELTPVTVDAAMIRNMQGAVQKKLVELEKAAHTAAGQSFSINSHPQLRVILFEKLKLHLKLGAGQRLASTTTGQHRSTCEATLTKLQHTHPLPDIILQYRQLQKLKSTYLDGLLSHVQRGGELYTHWDHTAAATGRLTSTHPNIQAVPKQPVSFTSTHTSRIVGKEDETTSTDILARAPFVSRHGYSFLAADFKQMEFRLYAHLAADPVLLKIFNSPHAHQSDVFTELTAQWKRTTVEEVKKTEKLREQTKRVVYSVMYGVGKEKLSEYLKTTPDEAKTIMNSFLASFPGVSSFNKRCVEEARAKGHQESVLGRRRYLPAVRGGSGGQARAQAERQAVNFCVQGSAADVSKAATVHVQRAIATRQATLDARLLFHIHDELLLEVADRDIPQVAELVKNVMEDTDLLCGESVRLSVPLPVSISVGKSWASLTSYTPTSHTPPTIDSVGFNGGPQSPKTDSGMAGVKSQLQTTEGLPYKMPRDSDAMDVQMAVNGGAQTDATNDFKPGMMSYTPTTKSKQQQSNSKQPHTKPTDSDAIAMDVQMAVNGGAQTDATNDTKPGMMSYTPTAKTPHTKPTDSDAQNAQVCGSDEAIKNSTAVNSTPAFSHSASVKTTTNALPSMKSSTTLQDHVTDKRPPTPMQDITKGKSQASPVKCDLLPVAQNRTSFKPPKVNAQQSRMSNFELLLASQDHGLSPDVETQSYSVQQSIKQPEMDTRIGSAPLDTTKPEDISPFVSQSDVTNSVCVKSQYPENHATSGEVNSQPMQMLKSFEANSEMMAMKPQYPENHPASTPASSADFDFTNSPADGSKQMDITDSNNNGQVPTTHELSTGLAIRKVEAKPRNAYHDHASELSTGLSIKKAEAKNENACHDQASELSTGLSIIQAEVTTSTQQQLSQASVDFEITPPPKRDVTLPCMLNSNLHVKERAQVLDEELAGNVEAQAEIESKMDSQVSSIDFEFSQ